MASIDLEKLSLTELKSLQKDIAKAIADFGSRKKVEALSALEEHAKSLGFTLAELTGVKARKGRAGSGAAKYRHPENPEVTWSGRGRKPNWFTAAIEAGKAPETMAV
jgi:DNA-binding protein H-NS